MDDGRLGHGRSREAVVGDLVMCIDSARREQFIALVLDKSISVYKLQSLNTGDIIFWPESATFLWQSKMKKA